MASSNTAPQLALHQNRRSEHSHSAITGRLSIRFMLLGAVVLLLCTIEGADARGRCRMKLCGQRLIKTVQKMCSCGIRTPNSRSKRHMSQDEFIGSIQVEVPSYQHHFEMDNYESPHSANFFLQRRRRSITSVNLATQCCDRSCCTMRTMRMACNPCD